MTPRKLTLAQEVGRRIAQERRKKAVRDGRDIDQKDVAKAAGVSRPTISKWEAGEMTPRDDALQRLADYFGVTPAYLRYGEMREGPPIAEGFMPAPRSRPGDQRRHKSG